MLETTYWCYQNFDCLLHFLSFSYNSSFSYRVLWSFLYQVWTNEHFEIKKGIKFVLFCFGFDMQKSSENLKFEFLEIIFSAYNFPNSQLLNIFSLQLLSKLEMRNLLKTRIAEHQKMSVSCFIKCPHVLFSVGQVGFLWQKIRCLLKRKV